MNQSTSTNSAPGVPTVGAEVDVDADPPAPIVEVVPPLPPLVLYGLEVPGDGMAVVGCGKGVIGTARHIRALSGFRTGMLIKMANMYSFGVGGDDPTPVFIQIAWE